MKNILLLLAGLLSWTHGMMGQDQVAATDTVGSAKSDSTVSALLWEISGDSVNTSYLFGTIHMIPADDYFLPEGTETAIANSEKMVFEIDLQEMMEDPMAQMAIMMKAFMSNGTTLSDLLSEEDYKIVKDHFDEIGMPLFVLERVKPMFLSVLASGDMSMGDASSTKSYEMEFLDIANSREMAVGGLETVDFQISVFDQIPYEDQAEMLVESIKQEGGEEDMFDELVEMYKSQDIWKLYESLAESDESMMEFEEILVSGRNKNWIPLMEGMMKENATFFAVGAGHLAGPEGVIPLLEARGYKVTPISGELGSAREKQRF